MAGKDGKLTVELLLQTIINLDEAGLKEEMRDAMGELQKILNAQQEKLGKQGLTIDVNPSISTAEAVAALSKYSRAVKNTQAEIDYLKSKTAKKDKARLNQQIAMVEAQKEGLSNARQAAKLINKNAQLADDAALRQQVYSLRGDIASGFQELRKLERQLKTSLVQTDAREELGKVIGDYRQIGKLRKVSADEQAEYTDAEILKRKRLLEDAKKYYKLLGGRQGLRGESQADARLKALQSYEKTLSKIKKYSGEDLPVISDDEAATKQQLSTLNNRKKLAEDILKDTSQLSAERKQFFADEVSHIDEIVAKNARLVDKQNAKIAAAEKSRLTDEKLAKDLYESKLRLEDRRRAQAAGGKSAEALYTAELRKQLGILEAQKLRVDSISSSRGRRLQQAQEEIYTELEDRRLAAERTREERAAAIRENKRIARFKALQKVEAAEARRADIQGYSTSANTAKLARYKATVQEVSTAIKNLLKVEDRTRQSVRDANERRALAAQEELDRVNAAISKARAKPATPKKTQAEKDVEKEAARVASQQDRVTALDRQIANIEKDKPTPRAISSIHDLAALSQVRREIQEQNKALADQDRQISRNGGVALRDQAARKALQEDNLRLLDQVSQRVNRLTGGWAGLNNTVKQFFRYAIAYGGMYELIAAFSILGRAVVQLDADLKNLQAVTAATESDMISMSGAIKQVALTTRFSAQEISQAATLLGQAGVAPEAMKQVLQATANFASAVGGSIETAADLITTFRQVYGELSETGIADLLTKAVNISKLTSEDLKTIVSISSQTARDMGLSAQQYVGAVTTLRNAGIKASTVSTGLRQLMIDIFSANTSSLKQLEQRYAQLGEPLSQAQIKQRFFSFSQSANPLLNALQELQRIGVGSDAKGQFGRLFEVRSMNVLRALIDNLGELRANEAELGFGGAAAEAAAIQMEALQAKITNVGAALTFFTEELTRGPVSALKDLADYTVEAIKGLQELELTLKAAGGTGLADKFSVGAGAGALLASVAGGGIGRKLLTGIAGGVGITSLGIGQEKEGSDTFDTTGIALTGAALLGAAGGLKGAVVKLIAGIAAIFGSIASAVAIFAGTVAFVGYNRSEGFRGVVNSIGDTLSEGVSGLFAILSDGYQAAEDYVLGVTEAEKIARDAKEKADANKVAAASARQLLEGELAEEETKFDQYKQLDPTGAEGLGKAATDFAAKLAEQRLAIGRVFEDAAEAVDPKKIDEVLKEYQASERARVAGSSENTAYLKALSEASGIAVEDLNTRQKQLVDILNTYSSLKKDSAAVQKALKKEHATLQQLTDQEIIDRGLTPAVDTFKGAPEPLKRTVLSGYDAPFEDVQELSQYYTKEATDKATAQLKAAQEAVVKGQNTLGERARQQAILIIADLHKDGHYEEAKQKMRDLFESQRQYYTNTADLAAELTTMFNAASQQLDAAEVEGPAGAPGTPAPRGTGPISGAYRPNEDFSDIIGTAKISDALKAEYSSIIELAAETSGVSARLIAALLKSESNFNKNALSDKDAGGIAQFIPSTAKRFDVKDRFDPNSAIPGAGRLLKHLLTKYEGNVPLALAGYNAGEGAVKKYGGKVPPYKETENYIAKITALVGTTPEVATQEKAAEIKAEQSPLLELDRLQEQAIKEAEDSQKTAIDTIRLMRNALSPEDPNFDLAAFEKIPQSARDDIEKIRKSTDENIADLIKVVDGQTKVKAGIQKSVDQYNSQAAEDQRTREEERAIAEKLSAEARKIETARLTARLDQIKREGGTPGEYAAVRSRITGLNQVSLREAEGRLEKGIDKSPGGIESKVGQAKLDAEREALISKELIDIRKYASEYNKRNSKILQSQANREVSEATAAAESAILQGSYEEAARLAQKAVESQKRADAAQLANINRIEDVNAREEALAAFRVRSNKAYAIITDLLEKRVQQTANDLKPALTEGARTDAEAQEFARQAAAGEAVTKEEQARRYAVQLEAINQLLAEQRLLQDTINQQLTDASNTEATRKDLLEQETTLANEILAVEKQRAEVQGKTVAAQGGVAEVRATFGKQAQEQVDGLEKSIGGTLVNSVNALGAAFVQAGASGESMGTALKNVFRQMFLQIATAITQALLLRALLGIVPGGAAKGGVVPGGANLPSGKARGGVIGYEEGGIIAGNPGVDTTPGAIIHPSGAKSPIRVTHREAILPQGMVDQLGPRNVQASIDHFNSTGVARFADGGLTANTYSSMQPSQQAQAATKQAQPADALNLKIVNVPGNSVVEDYLQSDEGQEVVLNVLEVNPQRARQLLG